MQDFKSGESPTMEAHEQKPQPKPPAVTSTVSTLVSQIVAPGDIVIDLTRMGKTSLRLGGGLRQDHEYVSVTKAGRLKYTKPNKYWVEGSQKRYIPNVEDVVIAVVVDRRFENFIVDIGAPGLASLPVLSFEGATRRNVPNLQAGSLLYLRVVKAHRDMTPELSCTDVTGKASGFGPLKNGYTFECSTGLARAHEAKQSPRCAAHPPPISARKHATGGCANSKDQTRRNRQVRCVLRQADNMHIYC
eukprot:c24474_g1_i3 orf=11-748(-)